MSDYLTITGFSTALYSTWYFVDELSCLFDCGDGACSGLLQKSRKVKHVFITHPDRDHLAGLVQFCQLNGRDGLTIYYPAGSGSFPALADFLQRFDPHIAGTNWVPLEPGDEVPVRKGVVVRAVENRHLRTKAGGQTRSLSYFVESVVRKLKPEHEGKGGRELAALRDAEGEDAISVEGRHKLLVYSGDTPVELDGRYDEAEILIHEATFLSTDELDPDDPGRSEHSCLDRVMEMVARSRIGTLIVGHFSSRYDESDIAASVSEMARRHRVEIPIRIVFPGKLAHDILAG
jgi:ribonuclease Z